jgi:hypothetical protein
MIISEFAFPLSKSATGLIEKEVAGELLLCDLESKKAYSLNRSAALVWKHADGRTSIEELATLLAKETGTPADTRVVEFALRKLDKDALMECTGLPCGEDANLDRRRLFHKLGWAAALLVALPMVTTVKASAISRASGQSE